MLSESPPWRRPPPYTPLAVGENEAYRQTIGNDGTQNQRLSGTCPPMLVRLHWQTSGNAGTAKPEAKAYSRLCG